MLSLNNKISLRQLQVLLILDIFGTGVVILPRRITSLANQDGWILIVFATIFALFSAFLISKLAKMFPNDSFVSYNQKVFGKVIAFLITISFVLKILINGAMEIRLFGEIVNSTLLFNTPFYVVSASLILTSAYISAKGYESRARIAEILIFVVFIPLFFVFSIAATDSDFTNLAPVLTTPFPTLLYGGFLSTIAFSALPFGLIAFPYLNNHKKAFKAASVAIIVVAVFMLGVSAITIAKFGAIETQRQMWPVLEMMDIIDIPGSFIERQDALVMSIWIISVFCIINASLFFSSILLRDCFKKGSHGFYILISAIIIFSTAFIPKNIIAVFQIMDFMFITFGVAFLFIIPLLLVIVGKVRGY